MGRIVTGLHPAALPGHGTLARGATLLRHARLPKPGTHCSAMLAIHTCAQRCRHCRPWTPVPRRPSHRRIRLARPGAAPIQGRSVR